MVWGLCNWCNSWLGPTSTPFHHHHHHHHHHRHHHHHHHQQQQQQQRQQQQQQQDLKYALWQRDLGEMGELEEAQVRDHLRAGL